MLKGLIVLLLLCFSTPSVAAPIRLKDGEALQGHFTQLRHLSGFERPIKSQGQFYYIPEKGLIWQTEKPFNTRLEINKDGIRQSIEGDETMTISAAQFPALKTLHEVLEYSLRGNWSELEVKLGTKLIHNKTSWSLLFRPSDEKLSMAFKELHLEGSAYLDHLIIKKTKGDWDEIHFSNQMVLPQDAILKALK